MKYSLRHAMIIIVLSQLIFSCGSDEGDNLQVCRVQSMVSYFADSITYEYSSNNKLNNVFYINRRNGEVNRKIILTYDGKERLSKVTDENFFGDTRNYELTYDNQDRPATSSNWVGQPTSPFITTFSYDDKSRLVKRVAGQSGYQFISRYTYDDKDNVAEVYYTNPAVSETLGLRYLSYDTKDRIYAGSKDAEILSVYIYGWDPGKNNALRAEVMMLEGGTIYGQPFTADFSIGYDEEGRVKWYSAYQVTTKNSFNNAKYMCK